ncbi:MAG TPA: acetylxylan esterase [Bryobacteraceae bacterium]|jgi:dienelactone hydrolase
MVTYTWIILALAAASALSAEPRGNAVIIDGYLREGFWDRAAPERLKPIEAGVPLDSGGEVRARVSGHYLYLGARLPESTGKVTARSIGKNPRWEEEDSLTFVIRVGNENDWMLQAGPLGAYSVKWRWTGETEWYTSSPEKCSGFMITAGMDSKEWQVEVAIPLSQLGSPANGVHVSAERTRAARAGVPEEHWRWPDAQPMFEVPGSPLMDANLPDPVFQPRVIGNSEPPIEVGRRNSIPPLAADWNDEAWRDVSVWTLYRNEPGSRVPVFPTEIKMVQDGHTLAVIARCAEPYGTIAGVRERDGAIDQDDSLQVYLAISGSSYVKYSVNSLGYAQDANGFSGGPRISRPHVEWNSPVRSYARQLRGEWIARLDLPLDFVANALGETSSTQNWRILLVRHRPGRAGEPTETSVLPVTQSITPYCPARYRRLALGDRAPSQVPGHQMTAHAGSLSFAPVRVFSSEERKQMALSDMLDKDIHDRTLTILQAEKRSWDQVHTLAEWESFRDQRLKALSASIGEWPERQPLRTRIMSEFHGDGYDRQNLVYQTRPGFWVTANLYLPSTPKERIPGIVIVHSLHAPKTQFELQDMGTMWAREGCAVLVMDQVGYGERLEGYPWAREAYHSRYITGMQLYLVGESLMKWMAWDIIRGIDLLLERKEIDEKQIILLGAVAGGGDPAAVVAALDKRVSAVVPFNFGESTPEIPRFIPEKNQWPLDLADPGLGDWDTTRCLRRGVIDQFLQWTICAMAAPRRFVYSYELGWNVEDLPAWARYKKVYELYGARDHLADAHGFGPFPGPGECWNIGPAQRRSLYPTLERWFGIPVPFEQMKPSIRANLTSEPSRDRRPEAELAVLTPPTASELHMRTVHELAREIGRAKVEKARSSLARLTPQRRLEQIRDELRRRLGDIEPNRNPQGTVRWTKKLPGATVEAITVSVEPGITLPFLLYLPSTRTPSRSAMVVGVAEGGKELFLANRSQEIEKLLRRGVAVCLPDVRGTGEISPDSRRDPENDENMQAVNEQMLGETLVGRRLKDLRTVLTYLEQRPDLDPSHVALWGESLTPVNGVGLSLDELSLWQVGPQIQQQGEPLGGLLAILGALYDSNVRTVVVNGGLVSFESVLDDAFSYVPADVTIPGFLEAGDLADIEAALAPRPMLLEGLIDGKNRLVSERDLRGRLQPLYDAYLEAPRNLSIRREQEPSEISEWLLAHL